jgi:hypothetical protein
LGSIVVGHGAVCQSQLDTLGGEQMQKLDSLDRLFIAWAFFFQIALIVHFAIRKPLLESYTTKYGWIVYALCIPAVAVSIIILRGGKDWSYWIGGFLFLLFSAFGFWVDYVVKIQFRNPLRADVAIPYVGLYLAPEMFYWWPLWNLSHPLWLVFGILYVIATILNITSH